MKKNRPEERNMRIVKVNKDSIANILSDLLKRSPRNFGDFQDKVDAIIKNVRDNGDKAVFDYTAQFDKAEINADNILVTEEEIKEAYEEVDDELIKVIRKAIKNIRDFGSAIQCKILISTFHRCSVIKPFRFFKINRYIDYSNIRSKFMRIIIFTYFIRHSKIYNS